MPIAADIKEKQELSKWEMAYVDSSGKFSIRSARGYHYYSVFVDRKDGEKLVICHAKKKNLPAVSLQFVKRVGVWPRVLVSDGAGEIIETKLQRQGWLEVASIKWQRVVLIMRMGPLSVLFRRSMP